MALTRIGWENGTLVESAKVLSDGTIQEAQYDCNTPLSAENLTKMEDNIENFVEEEVNDALNSLNEEYGTYGNWEYRKSSNGIVELWAHLSVTGAAMTTSWGGMYAADDVIQSQDYPFAFDDVPCVQVTVSRASSNARNVFVFTGNTVGTNTYSPTFGICGGSSNSSVSFEANLYVIGKVTS